LKKKAKNLKEWREKVLKRDNYTCQQCGKKARYKEASPCRLVVHHIKDKKVYPEYALNVKNGITLCPSCHKKEPVQGALFFYLNEKDGYGRSSNPMRGWYTTILKRGGFPDKLMELKAPGN